MAGKKQRQREDGEVASHFRQVLRAVPAAVVVEEGWKDPAPYRSSYPGIAVVMADLQKC